jgi:oligopeptide transport system ATP-binding protein
MSELLEVRQLGIRVGSEDNSVAIVDDVNFDVRAGEIVGLAGESGSGKTMTALALLGLLPEGARTSGRAHFAGEDLLALRGKALRKMQGRRVAMVFQDPGASLHPMLTVGRQLTEHMRHHLGINRKEAEIRALDLLGQVRIPDAKSALKSYPHQFSGGMRQRIQIASALACEPDLLVADEPTTALDVTVQAGILRLLRQLCTERGLGVIMITHDLGILAAVADRTIVMYSGRVIEAGDTRRLTSKPRHPYTQALLSSLPHPEAEGDLVPIAGTPPSPAGRPSGCAFHPRCPHAIDRCRDEVPGLVDVGGQLSACAVDPFAPVEAYR